MDLEAMLRAMSQGPTRVSREARRGTEKFALLDTFPLLSQAWPELPPAGWPGDEQVPPERGANPAWLKPGTVLCLQCHNYSCHERCGMQSQTHQRQSMCEYLCAQKARRAFPGAHAAVRSMRDACAAAGVAPMPFAALESVRAYFERCAPQLLAGAAATQLHAVYKERGMKPPWSNAMPTLRQPLSRAQLTEIAAARYGRALWRTVRVELADMVLEDLDHGGIWLSAVLDGSCAPPMPEALPPALEAYCELLLQLKLKLRQDATHERTRCELAPLFAPEPEDPDSFGRMNFSCIENGTPQPTPRAGWFTLFAWLPASARSSNDAVTKRVLSALAPLAADMGLARTVHEPQVLNPGLLFPMLVQNNDVTHLGKAASGKVLFQLVVSDRWVPAPCATGKERFGNLLEFTWRSATGGAKLESRVRHALQAEFEGAAPPAGTPSQLRELTAWSCCSVPHTRVRAPLRSDDKPGLELEVISGEAPEKLSEQHMYYLKNRDVNRGLSTRWLLWRGDLLLAEALMTYRNADVMVFGPGIELIGVRMSVRNQGFGTLLHKAIVTELLRPKVGWMPSLSRIGLMAIYVFSYHRWFEKMGYLWADESADVQASAQQSMSAVMAGLAAGRAPDPEDLKRFASQASLNSRRNEDGILPLFRSHACAACGVLAGPELKLLLCARCRCTYFCSEACQRGAWAVHKLDCRKLGRVFKAAPQ